MSEESAELGTHGPQSIAEAAKAFVAATQMPHGEEQQTENHPSLAGLVPPFPVAPPEHARAEVESPGPAMDITRDVASAPEGLSLVAEALPDREEVPPEVPEFDTPEQEARHLHAVDTAEETPHEPTSEKPRRQFARKLFSWFGRIFGGRGRQPNPELASSEESPADNVVPLHSGGTSDSSGTDQPLAA